MATKRGNLSSSQMQLTLKISAHGYLNYPAPMPPDPVFLQPRGFLRASGTWVEPVVPIPVPMNTQSPCSPGPCPSQHRLDPCLACLNTASNLVLPWAPSPISPPVEKTSHAEALSKKKKKNTTQKSELARRPSPTASPSEWAVLLGFVSPLSLTLPAIYASVHPGGGGSG